jgi:hypothetical protein
VQSGLIAIFFNANITPISAIIICLFCAPVLVANLYLEKCLPRYSTTPKLNLLFGSLLCLIFIFFSKKFTHFFISYNTTIASQNISYDLLTITAVIFIILCIIIAAFSIVTIRNSPVN